jgi:putative endonuclease
VGGCVGSAFGDTCLGTPRHRMAAVVMYVKDPAIYILASKRNGTLYVGVTSDLAGRVSEHKQDLVDGFTKRYAVHTLVHYEHFDTMLEAIAREKKLKKFSRAKKIALFEGQNQNWSDRYDEIQDLT